MPKKHLKSYTKHWLMKQEEGFGVAWNVTEILAEGRVKRRQNSLHVYLAFTLLLKIMKMSQGSIFYVTVNLHVHRLSSKWLQFVTFWFVKLTIRRENNVSCSVARGLNISSTFLIKQEIGTHVQYTQTDTNRQETLTNGTVGKKSPLVKEALWFAPLVRMESSSVHRTIYYSGSHYYLRAVLKAICWLVPLVQIDCTCISKGQRLDTTKNYSRQRGDQKIYYSSVSSV